MKSYAVISAGDVVNVVQWDGVSDWDAPVGTQLVQSDVAAVGWSFKSGKFTAPPAPPVPGRSVEN